MEAKKICVLEVIWWLCSDLPVWKQVWEDLGHHVGEMAWRHRSITKEVLVVL